jgi:hypothetical protein
LPPAYALEVGLEIGVEVALEVAWIDVEVMMRSSEWWTGPCANPEEGAGTRVGVDEKGEIEGKDETGRVEGKRGTEGKDGTGEGAGGKVGAGPSAEGKVGTEGKEGTGPSVGAEGKEGKGPGKGPVGAVGSIGHSSVQCGIKAPNNLYKNCFVAFVASGSRDGFTVSRLNTCMRHTSQLGFIRGAG